MRVFTTHPQTKKPLEYGTKAIEINERWDDKFLEIIEKESVDTLYLNMASGWETENYHFLSKIPKLVNLAILDVNSEGIEAIMNCLKLESIGLTIPESHNIDYSVFSNLKHASLTWKKGYKSIYNATSLEYLFLDRFKERDNHGLNNLKKLHTLKIGNSTICDLSFLEDLKNISWLELTNCNKITSINSISNLDKLERLFIRGSRKLTDLRPLERLQNLEVLVLDVGQLESLTFLKDLKNLKAFSYHGVKSKILDGNLTVLTELPNLSMVFLNPKKHYSHKIIKQWNWQNFGVPDSLLERK